MHYENSQISTCWQLARLVQGNHWGLRGPDYLLDRMMKMCLGGSSESSSSPIRAMSVHVFCIPHRVQSPPLCVTLPSPSPLWNKSTISQGPTLSSGSQQTKWWQPCEIYSEVSEIHYLYLLVWKLASWWLHIMMFYGQCKPLSPKTPWLPRYLGCVRVQIFSLSVITPVHGVQCLAVQSNMPYTLMLIISRVFLAALMFHQAHQKVGTHIRPVSDSILGRDKKKTWNQWSWEASETRTVTWEKITSIHYCK